ncbi:MAG: hypothetical protein GXO07_00595 [Crenarchaeota archaeon]|nr:hypothetical protein [Thermoproteota archaeon]
MKKASSELVAALLLAMITLGLVIASVMPGLKGMMNVGEGTNRVLQLIDLRERLAELVYARVGAIPSADCWYNATINAISCTAQIPYVGEAGGILVDKIYIVSSGVVECVATGISQAYVSVVPTVVASLTVEATVPDCTYTGYNTIVLEVVAPPVANSGTVTFAVTHPPLLIPVFDDVGQQG